MSFQSESKPRKTSKYFYKAAGTELGLFNSKELKAEAMAKRLSPDCQVRKDGDDRWYSAASIKGLFQFSSKTPNDSQPPELPSQSVPTNNAEKGLFGFSKKKDRLIANIGFAVIFGVIAIALIFNRDLRESILPWGSGRQSEEHKRVVDGKTVGEWENLTAITTSEQSGISTTRRWRCLRNTQQGRTPYEWWEGTN